MQSKNIAQQYPQSARNKEEYDRVRAHLAEAIGTLHKVREGINQDIARLNKEDAKLTRMRLDYLQELSSK